MSIGGRNRSPAVETSKPRSVLWVWTGVVLLSASCRDRTVGDEPSVKLETPDTGMDTGTGQDTVVGPDTATDTGTPALDPGCDGVPGSERVYDACGVCDGGGNGVPCTRDSRVSHGCEG
jgi:hypothetical protein